jgi:O-antigen/teichoic acid export membrane protein
MKIGVNLAASFASKLISLMGIILFAPLYVWALGKGGLGLISLSGTMQNTIMSIDLGLILFSAHALADRSMKDYVLAKKLVLMLAGFLLCAGLSVFLILWKINKIPVPMEFFPALLLGYVMAVLQLLFAFSSTCASAAGYAAIFAITSTSFNLLRHLIALPIGRMFGANWFFVVFATMMLAMVGISFMVLRRAVPQEKNHVTCKMALMSLGKIFSSSSMFWVFAIVWLVAYQYDKWLFSFSLPLERYGIYGTIANFSLIPMSVVAAVAPILLGMMTENFRQGNSVNVSDAFLLFHRIVATLSFIFLFVCVTVPGALLYAWFGNVSIAAMGYSYLPWVAVGCEIHFLCQPIYYLAMSRGELRQSMLRTGLIFAVVMPLAILLCVRRQELGAAVAWTCINAAVLAFFALPYLLQTGTICGFLKMIQEYAVPLILLGAGACFSFRFPVLPKGRATALEVVVSAGILACLLCTERIWAIWKTLRRMRTAGL